jgi:gas vesicle protein
MNTGKVVLGTLAGIAIGAVVGVLLAPDKGSETRRKIAKKKDQLTGDIKGRLDSLKGRYNDAIDTAAGKLESMAQRGEDMAKTGKQTVNEAKNTATVH